MLPITDAQASVALNLKKNSTLTVFTKWAKTQLRKSKIKPSDNNTTTDIEDRKQPNNRNRLLSKKATSNKVENNDDININTITLPKPNFSISFIEELYTSCPFILGHEHLPDAVSPSQTPVSTFDHKKLDKSQLFYNATIPSGSPRHFAYTQTLRKYKDASRDVRPLYNIVLLTSVLKKLQHTRPLTLSEEQELRLYKSKMSRITTQDKESRDPRSNDKCGNRKGKNVEGRSVSFRSFSFAQKARTNNKGQSQPGTQPLAPYLPKKITSLSQYRASYASQTVVITIDDKSNKLLTRDLPMARRHRRLFSSSDVPERASSLSSPLSSPSPAAVKKNSCNNQKWEKGTRIRPWPVKRNDVLKDDDDGHVDLDEVPLYVLREQYKYSGRNCSYSGNRELVNDGNKPMALAM
ncbi:7479_t:CDS:1 [Paraglomus occultum]|uniref:7479_t:CDS:1 n=1 Tax=Paraglomus occultum TaxID=144539 RepID=A0A9N8VY48_9GLOM|nr:7479_t:CDS:1 [Paraglomus occultum]